MGSANQQIYNPKPLNTPPYYHSPLLTKELIPAPPGTF